MVHRRMRVALIAVGVLAACGPSYAWGPVAQRAVVGTAFQVIGRGYADPFKTTDFNYEKDVLAGAEAGRAAMSAGDHPITSAREAMNAIGNEMQLLREVRKRGSGGSYFAYRMGVLAGLVSDTMFPLTFERDATGAKLAVEVENDIDKHLKSYQTRTRQPQLEYIRNPVQYFESRKAEFPDARTLLEADYARGSGYDGYASSSAPRLIQSTVEAVADVWFTVMRPEGDYSDVKPSDRSMADYFTDQVIYQLRQKKNLREAERAYKQFALLKSTSLPAYDKIGDAFYAFGPDGRDRAIQEWTNALSLSGPERAGVTKKLSAHYLGLGKKFLEQSSRRDAPADSLPNALGNFTKALEYDQSNEEAAVSINKTQVLIAERDQRLELAIRTLSAAESVVKQAEQSKVDQDFAGAIAQYKKAITVFEQVGDEFAEQTEAAEQGKESAKLLIGQIIKSVLDLASDRIEDGDRLSDQKKFDDAVGQYNSVETLLGVIPADTQQSQLQEKATLIEQAAQKVQDTEKAKRAFEEAQKNQQAVAPKKK
ncbi:MAG: hypothetical protein IT366_06155 [Candidatus Hydrogenedentes bacterium]|nr:hypothetical protein [Candidatus Hydrogenedentota bacterium]